MKLVENEDAVIVLPDQPHRATVIWMHGLGADGHDFVSIVGQLKLPDGVPVKFIFPHAEVRPVTLNGGMAMRAWYDIKSLDRNGLVDEAGIRASQARIEALIAEERDAGIASYKIVIAGFSQGGAIALQTALRHKDRLAGLMPLSTYLPLHSSLEAEAGQSNKNIPILMCHGAHDPVLPLQLGEMGRDQLIASGYSVDWHSYPMAHEVCMEEIRDIGNWLSKVLAD